MYGKKNEERGGDKGGDRGGGRGGGESGGMGMKEKKPTSTGLAHIFHTEGQGRAQLVRLAGVNPRDADFCSCLWLVLFTDSQHL